MFTSTLSSTSLISLLILTRQALISALPLQPRQDPSCTSFTAPFAPTCYQNLNIPDFLTNPTHGWNATHGQPCVSGDNAAYCCRYPSENWSTCFIRQAINLADKSFTCSHLNSSNCPSTSFTTVTEIETSVQPEVRYVLRNIYSIYNLFSTWSLALPAALPNTNTNIRDLTTEVDPQGTTSLVAPDVVEAFLLGLPFLATANASSQITPPISSSTNTTATALLSGLQAAPAVAQAIFVNQSETIYPVQSTGTAAFLEGSYGMSQLYARLNAGLGSVMSNLTEFVSFTSSGAFSAAENFTIPDQEGLDLVLQTAIESQVRGNRDYVDERTGLGIGL